MFETKGVPCYIERMGHRTVKIGKEKFKGTELVLRIDPFTAELASELGDLKAKIYRRDNATPDPNIDAVSFTLKPKLQMVEIRPDPQLVRPAVKLTEAKLKTFRVRRPSDGSQWVLTFRVLFAECDANDLLYLKEALFEQRFFTFADAQGGLFEEAEAEARREAKDAKPVKKGRATTEEDADLPINETAPATH